MIICSRKLGAKWVNKTQCHNCVQMRTKTIKTVNQSQKFDYLYSILRTYVNRIFLKNFFQKNIFPVVCRQMSLNCQFTFFLQKDRTYFGIIWTNNTNKKKKLSSFNRAQSRRAQRVKNKMRKKVPEPYLSSYFNKCSMFNTIKPIFSFMIFCVFSDEICLK